MDFALSEEQTAIFDMAHAFGQDRIAPHARAWERDGTIPKELWPEIAALGFGGLYVSEEAGGSGLTRLDATLKRPGGSGGVTVSNAALKPRRTLSAPRQPSEGFAGSASVTDCRKSFGSVWASGLGCAPGYECSTSL